MELDEQMANQSDSHGIIATVAERLRLKMARRPIR